MDNAPCMNCQERSITCHADCQKYKDWLVERHKDVEIINEKKQRSMDYERGIL